MLAAGSAQRARRPRRRTSSSASAARNSLYYLPLALTEKLGFFKEQGLNVEINDFKGGSQSLTALVGGSVDVVTGAYEHTLRMQAKGQDDRRRHRARPLSGHHAGGQEGPRRQDQDHRRPQGRQDRRHRAGLLHQHDRAVPDGQGGPEARRRLLHRRRRRRRRRRRHPEGRDRRHLQHRSGDRQAGVDRRRRRHGRDAHHRRHHQGVRRHRCRRPSLYLKRDFIEKNPNTVQALVNAFYKTLQVARQGDARADRRQRAAGILAGRQGALHRPP